MLRVILFLLAFATYIFLLYHIDWENYLPLWSDEYFYYLNSKAFYEFSSFQASLTFDTKGSSYLGADAHGIFYPLLSGVFSKLIYWHNYNLVLLNQLILFSSLLVVSVQKILSPKEKLLFATLILAFPPSTFYAMTYMQETLHLFFAVLIGLTTYKYYNTEKNKQSTVVLLVSLILLATLFRPLYIFWLCILLPKAKQKSYFYIYLILCLFLIVLSALYMTLFFEKVPNYSSSLISLLLKQKFKTALISFYGHFILNIKLYFFHIPAQLSFVYFLLKYMLISPLFYHLFRLLYLRDKQKENVTLFLVFFINFVLLFGLYDAHSWREIRSMSPLYFFYIIFFIKSQNYKLANITSLTMLIVLICSLQFLAQNILDRNKQNYTQLLEIKKKNDFTKVLQNDSKQTSIYLDFVPKDYSFDLLALPIKKDKMHQIIYVVPYYQTKQYKADYILAKTGQQVDNKNAKVIFKGTYFTLYQIK